MRIQTQLFLGTAALVLALVGIQWWLQIRQLRALELELSEVVTSVGKVLVLGADSNLALHPPAEAFAFTHSFERDETRKERGGRVVNRKVHLHRQEPAADGSGPPTRIEFRVEETDLDSERVLVISGMPGLERRVPIPMADSGQIVRATLQEGLLASALLLGAGLLAAGYFAHRVTGPLRRLSAGVEALGRGELGTQVALSAKGEVGDLEAAFNQMSARLAELEAERRAWRAREHLAELGDLARGLGHTLRNPLHTLGLVVEELAGRSSAGGEELVATARAQIRRVDRWLRSFLSIGAGRSAEPELADLGDLVGDVVLEAVQQGASVEVQGPDQPLVARVVPPALRAALGNLIGNALEASPEAAEVTVSLRREGQEAVLSVADRGPGLPEEVRRRLFSPHVTTKVEGSGMGLYLARQLVEGLHGGRLELRDAPGGGTVAELRLPLAGGA